MNILDSHTAQAILDSKFQDAQVQDVVPFEVGEGGFLSLAKFVWLTYKRDGNDMVLYLFVKLPPQNGYQKFMVDQFKAFVKEPLLYKLVLNEMKKLRKSQSHLFPECYLANQGEMLVLEDVSKLGFKTYRGPTECLNTTVYMTQVALVLKTIAEFHALSLKWEKKNAMRIDEKCPWIADEVLYPFQENHPGYKYLKVSQRIIGKICQKYKLFDDDLAAKVVSCFTEREYYDIVKPSKKYINVLTHLDLWRNNIMLKYDDKGPTEAILVDFQLARYCNPAIDVLFFIYANISEPVPELMLMRVYHNEFKAKAKELKLKSDIFEFKTFAMMVNESRVTALIWAFLNSHFVLMPQEVFKDILPHEDKHKEFIEVDRDDTVLNQMENNAPYREKILYLVKELANALTCDLLNIDVF